MNLDGSASITPVVLSGTTQLFAASQSSSSLTVNVSTTETCHVMLTLFWSRSTSIVQPTLTGNITNLRSNGYATGSSYTTLWILEFDITGDFTVSGYTASSDTKSVMEVTSLEAD